MTDVCLGADGRVVALAHDGTAFVEFADGTVREVSTAVLVADDQAVEPGDAVWVSMGMALRRLEPPYPGPTRSGAPWS